MSKINKSTLESGINVITEEMPDAESATLGIWVRTGSRNESPRLNGVSHFIEHLLFKGTPKRTALQISREIESVGGVLNAFTSREYTCFYAKVLNRDIVRAADLLSDIFLNPNFDPIEMDKERNVVLQEIKMVEDTPDDIIHDIYAAEFWKGHPLSYPILGPDKNIKKFTTDDIREYYEKYYRSQNVFIVAAGGVKHDTILKLMKKGFGKLKLTDPTEKVPDPVPHPGVKLVQKDLEQVHMCLGVPALAQPDPDRYKLYLMNTILGSGMSSRLFQEVREKKGLAYSIFSYLNLYKDSGSLVVYSGTTKENFPELLSIVLREFARMRRGVTKLELKEAKSQLKGGMLLGLESSENRMTKLARDEIYFGAPVDIKKIVASIDCVRGDSLERIASEVLRPSKAMLAAIGKVRGAKIPKGLKRLKSPARKKKKTA
jgi:predicted Zn-dependent peptidase